MLVKSVAHMLEVKLESIQSCSQEYYMQRACQRGYLQKIVFQLPCSFLCIDETYKKCSRAQSESSHLFLLSTRDEHKRLWYCVRPRNFKVLSLEHDYVEMTQRTRHRRQADTSPTLSFKFIL